ncbi:sporulation integral membrane protein YtvI [Peribacillus deserti]|uniref:Sporulation integral membrane protein YtvI n=1 Tax=Peribacillus deserti TaxID=673318 RepID=A0A2N5MA69_9BACI|nr:sporulation integral membrane protein YtvI [Peribacillus deserti]PLT31262.1 sporulation integral membrane protein YtvI [Peribacillus deserti]
MSIKWIWGIVIFALIILLVPYSWTLIFAFVTAVLLESLVAPIQEKAKLSRRWSVLASFLIYTGGLLSFVYFCISVLSRQIINSSQIVPGFVRELYQTVFLPSIYKWESYSESLPKDVIISIEETMEKGISGLEVFFQKLVQNIIGLVTLIPGFLIEFLIYLVALFLFSLELPRIKRGIKEFLKPETSKKLSLVFNDLTKAGIGFFKAQIILSIVTFAMASIGLWILKAPYILLLSILIVFVDILPILGTGSVLVPWAVISLLQGHQGLGIGLIVLFMTITVVRRIIEPKIYSTNMGLSPLAALISLYLGFKLIGFVGLFLGPALVIVFDTLKRAGAIRFHFKI